MELYNEINVVFMSANNIRSVARGSRSNFDFKSCYFARLQLPLRVIPLMDLGKVN